MDAGAGARGWTGARMCAGAVLHLQMSCWTRAAACLLCVGLWIRLPPSCLLLGLLACHPLSCCSESRSSG